jgi:hypothetical protein
LRSFHSSVVATDPTDPSPDAAYTTARQNAQSNRPKPIKKQTKENPTQAPGLSYIAGVVQTVATTTFTTVETSA